MKQVYTALKEEGIVPVALSFALSALILLPLYVLIGAGLFVTVAYALDLGGLRSESGMSLLTLMGEVFQPRNQLTLVSRFSVLGVVVWVIGGLLVTGYTASQRVSGVSASRALVLAYAYVACLLPAWLLGRFFNQTEIGWFTFLTAAVIVPVFLLTMKAVPLVRRIYCWLGETELESLLRRRGAP